MTIERIVVGPLATNCYLLGCEKSGEGLIIDPGGDADVILDRVKFSGLKITGILNTHGHFDHIAANREIKNELNVPIIIHENDRQLLTDPHWNGSLLMGTNHMSPEAERYLKEGDEVAVGECLMKVMHTPGHTTGGISLLYENCCFVGDTLFCGSIGRWDLPGGSLQELLHSVREVLMALPDDVKVYPGHGPETTIGAERESNPYVNGDENFF